jgi:endonuclease/exonuclease/phosphatase family metal-dependent hydrolase
MRLYSLLLFFSFFSCQALMVSSPDSIQILSWNLQNLFDDQLDGHEYPDFTPAAGWNSLRYKQRLVRIADAITQLPEGIPDILCFQEVENKKVLEDLAGYLGWQDPGILIPSVDGPNAPGILSRYFPQEAAVLRHKAGNLGLRPMIEATFFLGRRKLRVWNVHWKSRLPSPESTEHLRRNQARLLAFRLKTLAPIPDENSQWVVLGDFNSWPQEPEALRNGTFGPGIWGNGYAPGQAGGLPQWSTEMYTYRYRSKAFALDHMFFSPPLLESGAWQVVDVRVLGGEPFMSRNRINRYETWTGEGLSDHLPLLCTLVFEE